MRNDPDRVSGRPVCFGGLHGCRSEKAGRCPEETLTVSGRASGRFLSEAVAPRGSWLSARRPELPLEQILLGDRCWIDCRHWLLDIPGLYSRVLGMIGAYFIMLNESRYQEYAVFPT